MVAVQFHGNNSVYVEPQTANHDRSGSTFSAVIAASADSCPMPEKLKLAAALPSSDVVGPQGSLPDECECASIACQAHGGSVEGYEHGRLAADGAEGGGAEAS